MQATITNIKAAYNNNSKYAESTSNTGVIEFTCAVRNIAHSFYSEIQKEIDKKAIYNFIQKKLNEFGWDGLKFNKELPKYQNEIN